METRLGAVHVMRLRARRPSSGTILLLHGWPSSFIEMEALARTLSDPAGDLPAFDVLVPSLPGFGLSAPRTVPGPDHSQTADALAEAVRGLSVAHVWVHAYDIAAGTAIRLGQRHPDLVRGYHTTEPGLPVIPVDDAGRTPDELDHQRYTEAWDAQEGGYMALLGTRPQTIAYALSDSPAGLAAWLFEKWHAWTIEPDRPWDFDAPLVQTLLDTLTLYWVTGTVASANRIYFRDDVTPEPFTRDDRFLQPVSVSLTAQRIERAPLATAERLFADIRSWVDLGTGGHFVCAQHPALIADRLRQLITS